MSYAQVKRTVNEVHAHHGLPNVKNFAEEFADGVLCEKFYNIVFSDNNNSGIKPTKNVAERVKNWQKLNGEIFVGDLANRVYLDDDSMQHLAKGQDESWILKLLAVLLGIHGGTADGYASVGEQIELGDIDDAIVLQQPVTWNVRTEIVTASDTSDEERKTGVSREKVYQAKARKTLVEKRQIEQPPVIEEYESEEIVEQRRRVSKPKMKKVIYEEESSEEEVVVRRPRKKRQQVQYVEETVSESAEEIVEVRKPVVKQRITKVEPKVQQIVVEEPQTRVVKGAKETIKIPVKAIKQEVIQEEVNIETQADKELKMTLHRQKQSKAKELEKAQRELKMTLQELERLRAQLGRLEAEYQQKENWVYTCQSELHTLELRFTECMNKPTTEMRDKIIEKEVTEFIEKKVRKKTTETPYHLENWQSAATRTLSGARSARGSSPQNTSTFTSTNYASMSPTNVVRKSMSPSPKRSSVRKSRKTTAVSPGRASYVELGDGRSSITLEGRSLEQHYRKEELAKAKPELDAARQAIWNLDKATIAEVKSYNSPPRQVGWVVNAVMLLLGQEPTWANAKRLMADPNFKEKLRFVNPENIPVALVRQLQKEYLQNPQFTPQSIAQVSAAAGVLCLWVRAITTYAEILHGITTKVDHKVRNSKVVTYVR